MRICIYTHAPCFSGCTGVDEACDKLAREELKRAREYFDKAGGYTFANVKVDRERKWANYEQYAAAREKRTLRQDLGDITRRFVEACGIPPQMMPPADYAQRAAETKAAHIVNAPGAAAPKTKAANKCPGCARKIADNLKYCGRPKCYKAIAPQPRPADIEQTEAAVDAMHRQRGCSPFSLRWNWRG